MTPTVVVAQWSRSLVRKPATTSTIVAIIMVNYGKTYMRLMQGAFVGFWRGSCLRSEEGHLISEGRPQFIKGTLFREFPSALQGWVYLMGTGRYLGEKRGVSPAKYAVVRFTERRMNRDRGNKVCEFDRNQI